MMNKELLKKVLIYAGIIVLFAVIAYGFVPQVLSGKIVNQSDISSWKGMAQEAIVHNEAHPDDQTAWTNSMFGGMPTTAIIDNFEGDWTQKIYKFLFLGRRPATYLFITLVGAFLLMLSMGMNGIVAVAGAIAVAFCSYNMQIIQVGHNTKMQAIAFFPWVLAGIIFTYKSALNVLPSVISNSVEKSHPSVISTKAEKSHPSVISTKVEKSQPSVISTKAEKSQWKKWLPKTILGAVLFACALSFQIKANHIQITYYLAIVITVYVLALFISLCIDKEKRKKIGRFFAASALLLVIGCIGIATNANKLIPTYEYTPYTMRGGSELSPESDSHNSKGLDLDYATAWSYGISEMPNLLIPNFNGGSSSGALDLDSETGKLLKRAGQPHLKETMKALPLYWGPQPFTAGPMYLGAISIFLFMLGLFLCKGREKWWMLIASIVAILLAWGNHFMWFTKLWFDYAPLYNKFRTVSMALTVLQVTVPLLGFYALDKIIKEQYSKKEFLKAGYIAYALTAGFCLLCVLIPSIAGSFTGAVDAGQPEVLIDALRADRQSIMIKDALRSLILISVVFLLILWAYRAKEPFAQKGRMSILAVAVIFLVWIDLVSVGKRYLNKSHFITPKNFTAQYQPRPVDEIILQDTAPDYRVLDLSVNTFNSSIPSYHHKTIGGYSPVKLQRYQDLIEKYLSPEIRKIHNVVNSSETIQDVQDNLPYLKITSLLNGKYIILGEDFPPIVNPYASGNCFFVDSCERAATPDDEIALLGKADLYTTAVIGDDFPWAQEFFNEVSSTVQGDGVQESINLTSYAPNELRYSYKTSAPRAAIFSEIYYPKGWKAWIEPEGAQGEVKNGHYIPSAQGKEIDLFRADWILRGALLPEGEGELIMRFEPQSYRIGENISRASSILLILLLLLSGVGMALTARKKILNQAH